VTPPRATCSRRSATLAAGALAGGARETPPRRYAWSMSMRPLLLGLLLAACAGQGPHTLAGTPTARSHRQPTMPPPASADDKDRYQLNQQFEDMHDAQQAKREADRANAAPPPAALPTAGPGPSPAGKQPVKKGPAEQAPTPRGPAEQAPSPPGAPVR